MSPKKSPLRSFSELGDAVGQARAKHGLIDRKLDEVSVTTRRSDRQHDDRPFTATPTGRALFARYDILQKLAPYIEATMASKPPPEAPKAPRALRGLIRLVEPEVLALVAVDALINTIVAGWDWEDESAAMKVALAVGRDLRDEIEMARPAGLRWGRLSARHGGRQSPSGALALSHPRMVQPSHGAGRLVASQLCGGVRLIRE